MSFADKVHTLYDLPFSKRSFFIGLGVVAVVYGSVFMLLSLSADKTLSRINDQLARVSIAMEAPTEIAQEDEVPQSEGLSNEDLHAHAPEENDQNTTFTLSEAIRDSGMSSHLELQASPIEGYYEKNSAGLILPKKKDGRFTPFSVYKKPFELDRSKKSFAIIVSNYGLSKDLSKKIIDLLPRKVSVALSPYADSADEWQKMARKSGHEVWLELPIETQAYPYIDPGSKGLMGDASLGYNQDRLIWLLGRTSGYAGIVAQTDSVVENAAPMFKSLFSNIFDRGLGYIELNSERTGGLIQNLAEDERMPYAQSAAKTKIANEQDRIFDSLEQLININMQTLITVEPTPSNLEKLAQWIDDLQEKGYVLAPASAFADMPASAKR